MAKDDRPNTEARAEELAHLTGVFYRKTVAENLPPMIMAEMVRTYLQTLMLQDTQKPNKDPWE